MKDKTSDLNDLSAIKNEAWREPIVCAYGAFYDEVEAWKYIKTPVPLKIANIKHFDFFHSRHLDWRGLIERGLALEAPKDMYR